MRYPFCFNPVLRPLLLALGATRGGSFVEVDGRELRVRFGPLFDERLPLAEIAEVLQPAHWPLIGGIGWRTDFRGAVGLIGSTRGVVLVRLARPRRVRLFLLPLSLRELYVSLEQPAEFAAELRSRLRA